MQLSKRKPKRNWDILNTANKNQASVLSKNYNFYNVESIIFNFKTI